MVRMALNLLVVLVPAQMVLGDLHGANTLAHQPAKFAAIEGRYDTVRPLPLTLFGIPDDATGTMRYAVEIPVLGSLLLTHSTDGTIQGLDSFPPDQRPPVGPPFFGFRIMVGIAFIMLFVAVAGQILRRGGRLYRSAWFLRLCQWTAPLGFVAVIGRVDDDGGRAAALDRVWPAADGAVGHAVVDRHRRRHLAVALHPGLSHHVPDRHRLHGGDRAPRCRGRHRVTTAHRGRPAHPALCRAHVRAGGGVDHVAQPGADLDGDPRSRGLHLRVAGWLRSRRRHAARPRAAIAARDGDELDRPVLGWERNLAHPGRGGPIGSISRRVRDHHSRRVFPDPDHAAGAGVPWRGVRIPVQACPLAPGLGLGVLRRLASRHLRAGRRARQLHPGFQGRRSRVRWVVVRFRHAVHVADGRGPRIWLHTARCGMAGDENGRRVAGMVSPRRPGLPCRRVLLHRGGEPMDAAGQQRDCPALVRVAQRGFPAAIAGCDRSSGCLCLARVRTRRRVAGLCGLDRAVRTVVRGASRSVCGR